MSDNYATPAAIYFISIFFPILCFIAVALRFYTRKQTKTPLWVDDWLALLALALQFTMAGLLLWADAAGSVGRHLPPPSVPGPTGYLYSTSPQQIRLSKIQYFIDWIAAFQFGFVKLSILFFYNRIFCSSSIGRTAIGSVTNTAIVLVSVWTIAFGIGAILRCGSTPHYIWAPLAVSGKHCKSHVYLLQILKASTISDFIMDIFIWCLPIPKIWMLHMTTARKIAITSVFFVGLIAIGTSAARMTVYYKYIANGLANPDGEKIITLYEFWTMIEGSLGLIVACIPPLRPIGGKFSPGTLISGIKSALSLRSIRSNPSIERKWSGASAEIAENVHPNKLHSSDVDRNDLEAQTRRTVAEAGVPKESQI